MQTFHLRVGQDGRVEIPDTHPGQIVTIQLATAIGHTEEPATASEKDNTGPIPEEERAAIKERVMRRARTTREMLPEPWRSIDHGDLLYGDDGLPK